jgi:hypothetical protein
MRRLLLPLIAVAGCAAPPPEAPAELGELMLYLFAEYDNEDPRVMEAGVDSLQAFLEGFEADGGDLTLTSEDEDRSWAPPVLTPENYGTADPWADADPNGQLPVMLATVSGYSPADHAGLIGLADQTPIESSSSAAYDRTIDEDLDAFLAGDADVLMTSNAIHRQNFLLDLNYTAPKQFRWVTTEAGTALVTRSWIRQQFVGNSGTNTLDQFNSVEVMIPVDGGSYQTTTLWGQTVLDPAVADNILINTVRNGMQESFENSEAYLDAN